MRTIFDIGSEKADEPVVLFEIGAQHIFYALTDAQGRVASKLVHVETEAAEQEAVLKEMIETFRNKNISKVYVSSSFPQAVLMPSASNKDAKALLQSLFGETPVLMKDEVNEWQLNVHFSIPQAIHNQIVKTFSTAKFFHSYSCALKTNNGVYAQDQVAIHFNTKDFQVIVKKEGKLLLAQVYQYVSPLDVIYFLLKICTELNLDQQQVYLVVSGLVEKDSALYKQLNDYFFHISFEEGKRLELPATDLPLHYFTSVHKLATCAL